MDLSDKKVAILTHDYFEQAELEQPLKALKDAAAEVHIVSASGEKQLQGLNHIEKGEEVQADVLVDDAKAEEYDALVLPGGAINADALRMSDTAREWVRSFMQEGKPLAVICHAPWVLVSSGVANGKKLTSF